LLPEGNKGKRKLSPLAEGRKGERCAGKVRAQTRRLNKKRRRDDVDGLGEA